MDKHDKHDAQSDFYSHKLLTLLTERVPISNDSYMFKFEFKNQEEKLDMLVTQHILI